MYKLILLTAFLASCSLMPKKLTTHQQKKLECVDYIMDKGLSYDDAIKVCEYSLKEKK